MTRRCIDCEDYDIANGGDKRCCRRPTTSQRARYFHERGTTVAQQVGRGRPTLLDRAVGAAWLLACRIAGAIHARRRR